MTEVEHFADDVAVMKLIARIAHLADSGDLSDYAGCFTDDATWNLPSDSGVGLPPQTRAGIADIVQGAQERRASGMQGPGSRTRHVVSTIDVEVEGDTATSKAYWRYYGNTDATPQLLTMGQYDDTFRRTSTGWRLQQRTITRG
jgi:3-phenylpropionate/cinnamic acid dioxygenase small subunit